jgi:beta-phosphoglucomutase-like phosphatase (HAD superfamily)
VRAAIFDYDGVIANSEPLHFVALRDTLQEDGVRITEDEYYRLYLAYDDRGALRLALEHHGVPFDAERVDRLARRKAVIFEKLLPTVPFFPGVPALVRTLAAEVPLAIASGARREEIEAILTAGGLRDAFAAIVGADDVVRGKPDPEPYLTAAARLALHAPGLRPEECVAFEDSLPGIAAARNAGMKVVAVTNSFPAARLTAAHHVVGSLEELDGTSLRALFAA